MLIQREKEADHNDSYYPEDESNKDLMEELTKLRRTNENLQAKVREFFEFKLQCTCQK